MKFTLSWLKEHLDTDASLIEITEKLTDIGLELEGIENPADAMRPFTVAKIISAKQHPNADKLRLLSVDDGSGDQWQVVCGAPNAIEGLVGVFAPPGTYVPGADFTIKATKIRDVESVGMMCSEKELEISDEHDGIIALPDDAPIGMSYADYAQLDDPVIDVSVTPNKQDCMGVRGIARDLAASGIGNLKPLRDTLENSLKNTVRVEPVETCNAQDPSTSSGRTDTIITDLEGLNIRNIPRSGNGPDVRSEDSEGCPAFYATTVKGVKNGPSPAWMQQRLRAIGQNPISALVDITNYVMLDHGRPLHVYDIAKLNGNLVARKANAGEEVLALNGKTYALDDSMTVIADDDGAHDIGGIMGGEKTGAGDDTVDVLIECAYFTPESIAKTGQKLMLTSDARQRFERGVDPAFLADGLDIATALVLDICGGQASEMTKAGNAPDEVRTINYNPMHCSTLGGINVDSNDQVQILNALGFGVDQASDIWSITIPTWRRDVVGSADIVEEIIRIKGLDKIAPVALPKSVTVAAATATPLQVLERKLRRTAAASGLNETINWSFISEKEAALFGGDWVLANPISEDLKVMRTSLLPGLLSATKRNIGRGASSVRLFEIGRRYFKAKDGSSDEKLTLGIILSGDKMPRDWQSGKSSNFNPYDAKSAAQTILSAAGVDVSRLMVMDEAGSHYHPGQSATLRLGPKNILAAFGALHPTAQKAFGIKGDVMAAEIYLDNIPLPKSRATMRSSYAPPSLQSVKRDFAFLLDETIEAGKIINAIRGADKANITDARIFDRFAGEGVPDGKISLAVEVTLQPRDASFTDEDLAAISDKIIASAGKFGAELRG